MALLSGSTPEELGKTFHKSKIFISRAYERERASINSLDILAEEMAGIVKYIAELRTGLSEGEKNSLEILAMHYRQLCGMHGSGEKEYELSEREVRLSNIVPLKTASLDLILKDIFARPSYKTFAPWRAESQEVFNFIDGKRSILDIAHALEIEFGRPYLDDTEKYMELLKGSGYIDY